MIDGGNPARIRARAEELAALVREEQMAPLEVGYLAMVLSLKASANYVREAADRRLSIAQLYEMADRLAGLADDAALLGEAATGGPR